MEKLDIIKVELIEAIQKIENKDWFDMSDLGNEIGVIIGKHTLFEDGGMDKDSFISGIKHGISLSDGTHDNVITIDIEKIKQAPDNSITNHEIIRQIALYSNRTGDTSLIKKIYEPYSFAGLYPETMKSFVGLYPDIIKSDVKEIRSELNRTRYDVIQENDLKKYPEVKEIRSELNSIRYDIIQQIALKRYPVSLTTYNEEAVDVNFDQRQEYMKKLFELVKNDNDGIKK